MLYHFYFLSLLHAFCNVLHDEYNKGNKSKRIGLEIKFFPLKSCCFELFRLFRFSVQHKSKKTDTSTHLLSSVIITLLLVQNCIFCKFHWYFFFHVKDNLNDTVEGRTVWTVTTLDGEQESDGTETKLKGFDEKEAFDRDIDAVSSLKINLTVANSTFNSTTTQEVRIFCKDV